MIRVEDFQLLRDGRLLLQGDVWEVAPGERVLLTGASGTGKSSFLLALAGLAPEHAPGLELRGRRFGRPRTAMVFQNPYAQLVCPTVEDEIAFALENAGWDRAAMRERVEELRDFFDLHGLGSREPWTFSGGEAQRTALAAALAPKPDLMLMDEPLGYLDEATARRFIETAGASGFAARPETAWVVVDHDPQAWASWADTRYHLSEDRTLRTVPRPWVSRPIVASTETGAAPKTAPETLPAPAAAQHARRDPPVLEIRGLTAGYGKGPDVLRGLSLSVEAGETVALVGPSGCGKSTVFRCLTGQLKPRAGSFRVDGRAYRPRLRAVSPFVWVPQVPEHYFVYQTAREEWSAGAAATVAEGNAATAAARDFGLEPLAERHPFTLSEGEKRRLNLASALAASRRVILLDEPQFALDAVSSAALEAALAKLRARGQAMIIISHDRAFCARVSHRVLELPRENVA